MLFPFRTMLFPSRNLLPLFTVACGLMVSAAARAQMMTPGTASPSSSAPSSGVGVGGPPGAPAAAPSSASNPVSTDAASSNSSAAPGLPMPSATPSSPGGSLGTGAYSQVPGGTAPTSPAVPLLSLPLPSLANIPAPQAGQGTLPAAPPSSFLPRTAGAVALSLTADEVVVLAARRSLGLQAALQDAFAVGSGVQSARVLAPPSFTIGPAFRTGGTTDGLLFLQPLELNGTRGARTEVARAQLRVAQAQAVLSLQNLVYTARLYFYALAQAQANLALQQSLLASAQQFDRIALAQVKLGARPGIEAVQTAIQVARARQITAQAAGEEQAARAALNAYLGRAPLDPVDTSRALTTQAVPVDIAAAQQMALDRRAEITVARASRDVPNAQASLYRAQGRPDVSPSFRISQITPTYMDAGVGVVVSVPLDYGTRRGLIRQQQQNAQAQDARLVGAQAQVRLDAEQAVIRLNAAQAVLNEYDAGMTANAHAVLASALAGYKAGGTSIISVLDAQRTYRQILSDRLASQAAVVQAQAALERATGAVPQALVTEIKRNLQIGPIARNKGSR